MSADRQVRLTGTQLLELADDAFDVLNWAKRNGLRKDAQVAELVRTFEVRLGYREPVRAAEAAE
ncbi:MULTISPECIES: hypothetical protein [unclassified Mesorhizobium]|uniref:hypothetical protein n=1 Tax=unclassified Mesorhizobium TaxID=325217 RepID=UPI00112E79AE|nr:MULTISPECIES: hypothetical protein [unclassified Mesorhizobium]TPJ57048.1 hypothetical protein FJ443_30365 [Mesorhizobium sp. B2-6-1]TPN75476.1 hypothetical protein FJ980_31535 [Mesorhizobium sp. B1-1-5]